jgi:pilus assembly protein FimV
MHSSFRQKPIAFQLKKLSAAVALAMVFSNAGAAGWGDLTVMSSLGQPLRAEIELVSASRQDEGPLTVRLASFDAYRKANIEFNPALMSLRFAVEQRGEKQFVRISSTQPLNEPFVDMLLELSSNSGRVVREYVFLLDPPGFDGAQTAVVAPVQGEATAPASAAKPAARPAAPAAAKPAGRAAAAPAPARRPDAQAPARKQAAPAAAKPRLTLSGVTATSATDDKAGVIALEDYATMEKSVAEANARVKALEQKVEELQKLLDVTNKLLAELQKQNELANAGAKPAVPADTAPANAAVPAAAAAPAPETKPAAAPAPATPKPVAPPPPAESDSSTYLLPGAAFLVALLGAAGIFLNRRRKAKNPFGATLHTAAGGDKTAQHTAAADTMTTALGTGLLLPTGLGQNHEVDPLAEADVYIAYGRDVQAEEILKEALRKQPDRHAVRVKLLSIYAGRKDLEGFDVLARELYGMTRGEGDDWKQAAALGSEIDPGNPLYAASRTHEEAIEPAEAADIVPEPALVLERITGDEPVSDGQLAAGETVQGDVPLPDLTPAEEVAQEPSPAVPPVMAEVREPGPGPIDFDFLKPVDTVQEQVQEAAAIPDLPTAALGDSKAGGNTLDFDFLKPEEGAASVPELPSGLLDQPQPNMQAEAQAEAKQDEVLLDFDFLKQDAVAGEPQDDARKQNMQPNP